MSQLSHMEVLPFLDTIFTLTCGDQISFFIIQIQNLENSRLIITLFCMRNIILLTPELQKGYG